MDNEFNEEVVLEEEQEETQEEPQSEEQPKPERQEESLEDRRARLQRQLAQTEKKLGLDVEKKPETKTSKQSNDFDYGQKAFLVANGIKGNDEIKLAQEFAKNTGKSLEDVVENKYFLQELNEVRELRNSANAVPKGRGKTGNSSQDSVDYWLAKGELPSDFELRKKVVNARLAKENGKSVFD